MPCRAADGSIVQKQLSPAEVDELIRQVQEEDASAGDV